MMGQKMLQVLLFKTLNLLELKMLLIYITEGCSVLVTWFKAHVQQEHSCGTSAWWPTWKTGLTWKPEELHAFSSMESVSVFLVLVDSPPLQCPTVCGTADSELATKIWLGNVVLFPYILDLASVIFISFPHWRSTCYDIVSPLVKMSKLLPSCGWHNRDLCSVHLGWTNMSHIVTRAPVVKGTVLKNNLLLAPSFCIVSFHC